MAKHKLARFAENETFSNLFQHTQFDAPAGAFPLKGNWNQDYFFNTNPIVLELGCGKGEYTIGLAKQYPDINFIGVDRKGARLWRGCKDALEQNLKNVAFIRTAIDDVEFYFGEKEVREIWITFPDPQPVKPRKRLMSPKFIDNYKKFLVDHAVINLKTDSRLLYEYVLEISSSENWAIIENIEDVYAEPKPSLLTEIQTFYEKRWISEGSLISYLKWMI